MTATTMKARFHTKSSTRMGLERLAKPSEMSLGAEVEDEEAEAEDEDASEMSPSAQSPRRIEV